jgi:hypothetical protein
LRGGGTPRRECDFSCLAQKAGWIALDSHPVSAGGTRSLAELHPSPDLRFTSLLRHPHKNRTSARARPSLKAAAHSTPTSTSPHHNNGRPNPPTHPSRLSRAVSRRKHQHPAAAGYQAGTISLLQPVDTHCAHCARSHSSATASPTRPTSFPPLPAAATSSARSRQEHC